MRWRTSSSRPTGSGTLKTANSGRQAGSSRGQSKSYRLLPPSRVHLLRNLLHPESPPHCRKLTASRPSRSCAMAPRGPTRTAGINESTKSLSWTTRMIRTRRKHRCAARLSEPISITLHRASRRWKRLGEPSLRQYRTLLRPPNLSTSLWTVMTTSRRRSRTLSLDHHACRTRLLRLVKPTSPEAVPTPFPLTPDRATASH